MGDQRGKPACPEAKAIARIAKILDAMPRDGALRALAYLTSRALGVGTWVGAEHLYEEAQDARAAQ